MAHFRSVEIENGKILPYKQWTDNTIPGIPSINYLAVGVGGILYPPKLMNNSLFNKNQILECCPSADDIWLKCMQIINIPEIKVIQTSICKQHSIPTTQNTALYHSNLGKNENDIQIDNLQKRFNFCDKLIKLCQL